VTIPRYFFSPFDLPEPEYEFRFHPTRRWRIDCAWPAHKLAVEIEGGAYCQGRHVRGTGFIADMCKYNELTLMGWSLLRFTPQQVKNGEAIKVIHRWFNRKSLQ
jgi:very-short-patch-repair endonuclease